MDTDPLASPPRTQTSQNERKYLELRHDSLSRITTRGENFLGYHPTVGIQNSSSRQIATE